jgi:hypothetical protein
MKAKEQNKSEFGGRLFYHRTIQNQDFRLNYQLANNQDFVVPWQLTKTRETESIIK